MEQKKRTLKMEERAKCAYKKFDLEFYFKYCESWKKVHLRNANKYLGYSKYYSARAKNLYGIKAMRERLQQQESETGTTKTHRAVQKKVRSNAVKRWHEVIKEEQRQEMAERQM